MHLLPALTAALLAPVGSLAAPAGDAASVPQFQPLYARENLCNLKAPPQLCTPNASVTVEETALRAYQFYRAFVVDGDPRTMFSLIDNVYQVSLIRLQVNPAKSVVWTTETAGISNTTPATRAARRRSGRSFATGGRWEPSRARAGVLTPARTCRMRNTRLWTGGGGWEGVSTST